MSDALPMFPLGTVLVPGMLMPLHVFEPRYRALLADCQAGEPEFGVVLIERGREVGGGDVRRDIGTVARILEIQALPGGRSAVVSVGTRRFRVARWLPDDPYPRAEIDGWPDEDDLTPDSTAVDDVVAHLRRVLALASEAGERAPAATAELADDPILATYHASALAPVGDEDRYRLLAAPGPAARCRALEDCLTGVEELLRFRLERGL
jgi:Lon protease-like protein